jgi:hypothetical protein
MDTAAVEFEEFLSRSLCQLVTSVGWPHGRRWASRNGPASANPPCASPQAVRVPSRHRA